MSTVDVSGAQNMNTRDMFFFFKERVSEIDAQLDANEDSKARGKRQAKEQLIDSAKNLVEKDDATGEEHPKGFAFNSLIGQLKFYVNHYEDENIKYGTYYAIVQELTKAFNEEADKLLEKIVAENTPPEGADTNGQDKLDSEKLKKLLDQRKSFYDQMKVLQNLNVMMGNGTKEDYELPSRRMNRSTGTRAITMVDWKINGENLPQHSEASDLLFLQKKYGYATTKDLRDAMIKAMNVKSFKTLPDPAEEGGPNITFTLPNGDVLNGYKNVAKETSASSDEDDDDDDEQDVDSSTETVVQVQ